MPIEDPRLVQARLRTEVRAIDARLAQIQEENRLFRRYGFGSDVHEIQMSALRAERDDRVEELASAGRARRRSRGRGGLGSWLVLPAVLGAMVFRLLRGRTERVVRPA